MEGSAEKHCACGIHAPEAAPSVKALPLAGGELPSSDAPTAQHCPVEATLGLIGGKYKALILWKLLGGTMRFSELRRAVPGATPKMLTQQLRELEADGLVHREVFPVIPPRVEYSLTELGRSIRPVLEAMYAWGSGWLGLHGLCPNCAMQPLPQNESDLEAKL